MASLISGAIGGLAGLFGGGQQQKTQTSGTISNTQTGNYSTGGTTSNTANLSPIQQALIQQFTQGASNLYNQSTNLTPYTSQGLQQIDATGNSTQAALNQELAAKGQSYGPAATAAQTQARIAQGGQQSQFLNSIPLLQRQLQQQALGQLVGAYQVLPTNSTQTTQQQGTTSQSGTQTEQGTNLVSGNPLGGLLSGIGGGVGSYLPGLFGSFGSGTGGSQGPLNSSNYIPGGPGDPNFGQDDGG